MYLPGTSFGPPKEPVIAPISEPSKYELTENQREELVYQRTQLNDKLKGHECGRTTDLVAVLVGLALALFLNI